MGTTKAVRNAINRTFLTRGGVFWQKVGDGQLSEYWLKLVEEYLGRPLKLQNRKKAALSLGKQQNQDVYFFGENVQVR